MALEAAYKQFLAAPSADSLAANASLHYITSLTSLAGSSDIIKHLNRQNHELKKKKETFLDVVEGTNALAVEVHTTMEFVTGGGAYLPKLDDNFLADRIVNFPIVHIVTFDPNGKIQQIRQNWDQGSLLKSIDVIGRTGRNWPIHDGNDQLKLITSSVKAAGRSGAADGAPDVNRSRGASHVTHDPHASSLSLFAPREKYDPDTSSIAVAPRTSAKPPQREYSELFVGNESDQSSVSTVKGVNRGRSQSPSKSDVPISKLGAGKNYAPSRLFDHEAESAPSPLKKISPNSKNYQHFDFANGNDEPGPQPTPAKPVQSKHGSQWNFDDFTTPAKVVPGKLQRTNEVRHWGNSDDEVMDSPIKAKKVDKPRKSAETHFEFIDDGTPEGERRVASRPRGQGTNNGLGLYKDNLHNNEDGEEAGDEKHVSAIANSKDRRKDFEAHFAMADNSPASKPAQQRISDDRAKAVKMMDANWSSYDQSPNQKENGPTSPGSKPIGKGPLSDATNKGGIAVGGDGMGGKKGLSRQWGFGDESGGEDVSSTNSKPSKFKTGKTSGKPRNPGGDFWDF